MSTPQSSAPELLTRPQAAQYMGLKPQTLGVWASTGRYALPMVRVGRKVLYRRTDLDVWLQSRTCTHAGELAGTGT